MPTLQGFEHVRGALDEPAQIDLLRGVQNIIARAPLYVPAMPRTGKRLSVAMTNAGPLGWVTDQAGGYRYQPLHPETQKPWPAMLNSMLDIWWRFAPAAAPPEACLVNFYGAAARLGSHVDRDETDLETPVISISLGDDAVFHVGGLKRSDPKTRMILCSGDVVVLGGQARLAYHGIDRVVAGTSRLIETGGRINLTLRRVSKAAA